MGSGGAGGGQQRLGIGGGEHGGNAVGYGMSGGFATAGVGYGPTGAYGGASGGGFDAPWQFGEFRGLYGSDGVGGAPYGQGDTKADSMGAQQYTMPPDRSGAPYMGGQGFGVPGSSMGIGFGGYDAASFGDLPGGMQAEQALGKDSGVGQEAPDAHLWPPMDMKALGLEDMGLSGEGLPGGPQGGAAPGAGQAEPTAGDAADARHALAAQQIGAMVDKDGEFKYTPEEIALAIQELSVQLGKMGGVPPTQWPSSGG